MVCVAVLREGFEVVLFVYGATASGGITALDVATGVGLGVLGGAAVAGALYLGLAAIPLQHVFKVISVLITLLAAGPGRAGDRTAAIGRLPPFWSEEVWNTSHILRQSSIPGRILHTLVGYQQKPTGLEIVAYIATIVGIVIAMRRVEATAHAKGTRLPRPEPGAR